VILRLPGGANRMMMLDLHAIVADVLAKINGGRDRCRLVCNGRSLQEDESLTWNAVENGSVLDLLVGLSGGSGKSEIPGDASSASKKRGNDNPNTTGSQEKSKKRSKTNDEEENVFRIVLVCSDLSKISNEIVINESGPQTTQELMNVIATQLSSTQTWKEFCGDQNWSCCYLAMKDAAENLRPARRQISVTIVDESYDAPGGSYHRLDAAVSVSPTKRGNPYLLVLPPVSSGGDFFHQFFLLLFLFLFFFFLLSQFIDDSLFSLRHQQQQQQQQQR
jgi:hypothetical protein